MKQSIIILFLLFYFTSSSQKIALGLGFEVNQTRFRQFAPTIFVPFKNPHKPDFGINAHLIAEIKLNSKIHVKLSPELSILKTKSKEAGGSASYFWLIGSEIGYTLKNKYIFNLGVQYYNLIKFEYLWDSKAYDFTYRANNRTFLNPTISLGYKWSENIVTYLRFIYFTKDISRFGALDYDGNLVGPVYVTPYTFSIGFDYKFDVWDFSKKDKHYRKKKIEFN